MERTITVIVRNLHNFAAGVPCVSKEKNMEHAVCCLGTEKNLETTMTFGVYKEWPNMENTMF